MSDRIQNVAVIGASGTIGSLTGGIMAQEGLKVYFLSRTPDGAERGLQEAVVQARSEVISRNIICGDYDHLLGEALSRADLVIESLAEDLAIKRQMYERIDGLLKSGAIVGTTTSSLPIDELAKGRSDNFRRHFLSTHFYNPPGRMLACEIASAGSTDPEVFSFMKDFLGRKLRRVVVPVRNSVAFAGNRIAFLLFNRITELVGRYGTEMVDYLIGPYTGRMMPPLATLDLVGLDIHRAIMKSLQQNTADDFHKDLKVPEYIDKMLEMGCLGRKTPEKGGFYRKLESGKFSYFEPTGCGYIHGIEPRLPFVEKAKDFIHLGMYRQAFEVIKQAPAPEAEAVRQILCMYIAHSYSLIGQVTEERYGIGGIDLVMSAGFNWAPPSLLVEMFGGRDEVVRLLEGQHIAVPGRLDDHGRFRSDFPNWGRYFIAH